VNHPPDDRDPPSIVATPLREGELVTAWRWLVELGLGGGLGADTAPTILRSNLPQVWQLLREMPVGLVLYDADFRVVYQNPASEAMTGWRNEEIVGRSPIGAWMPVELTDSAAQLLRRQREERVALQGRGEHRRRDGRRAWVKWFTTPLFDGEQFLGYLGVHSDISEELRAFAYARETEAQIGALIDAAVDLALVQVSAKGDISSWSASAQRLFGFNAQDVLGRPIALLMPAEESRRDALSLTDACVAGRLHEREGWLVRQPGDARFWGGLSLYPVAGGEGDAPRMALVARDLTARREAQLAQQRAQADLSALAHRLMLAEQTSHRRLAQLVHDQLGQTLTALRFTLEGLEAALPAGVRQPLDDEWQRANALVERSVREVREVLSELRPQLLQERGLAVALDNELRSGATRSSRPAVRLTVGDGAGQARWPDDVEYAFFMVAREALVNARHHAACQEIEVCLDLVGPRGLRLSVTDDGCGLPDSDQQIKPGHLGLVGMKERAQAIGAAFDVARVDEAGGTRVVLRYGC
jgi:PAS domain S-box-containing protein